MQAARGWQAGRLALDAGGTFLHRRAREEGNRATSALTLHTWSSTAASCCEKSRYSTESSTTNTATRNIAHAVKALQTGFVG